MTRRLLAGLLLLGLPLARAGAADGDPRWIWGVTTAPNELRFFRHSFELTSRPRKAVLTVAADDQAVVSVNDQPAGRNDSWKTPAAIDITRFLNPGPNQVGVVANNGADASAGLLARIELVLDDGSVRTLATGPAWETSADGATWVAVRDLGAHGTAPWGDILKTPGATPVSALKVLPGFQVELIKSATLAEGSWISLAFDPKGRLWISPQDGQPLQRITLRDGKVAAAEAVPTPARNAMGLHWAFDSLYLNGRGTNGLALYRLRDTDGDDRFDQCQPVRYWKGNAGEHGPHGIASDGSHLYVVNGNFVDVPDDLAATSPVRSYADDLVLPRLNDGSPRRPPGGYVLRMKPDGTAAELFSAGQRNAYDIAFNEDGELFAFDSDAEADWSLPWYRPNRLLHCIPGADHGFREGSGKWPGYYADGLPAVVDTGLGSPTGLASGRNARFPERYRRALFGGDWAFGRIVALPLQPDGASYTGAAETLVQGRPLNVTDLEVGPDGALYFITGGRGTQSGLYRVAYTGTDAAPNPPTARSTPELATRRSLSEISANPKADALDRVWPGLASPDRTLRFAARIALESFPVDAWRDRALAETNATAGLHALLALARMGTPAHQPALLKALGRWPLDSLPDDLFLVKLRVIEVSVARHGMPSPELRQLALDKLGRQYPGRSWPINRELSQLLVAFGDPTVVAKTLALRDRVATHQEAIHYTATLRQAREGWTPDLRRRYFTWFHRRPNASYPDDFLRWFREVSLKPTTGSAFDAYIRSIHQQAVIALPDSEKGELAGWINGSALTNPATARLSMPAPAPKRTFVRSWKIAELEPRLASTPGNPARGRDVYAQAQCQLCHRRDGEGGGLGPDLTGTGAKYSRTDLLRSLLEPSAVVSEQYQATVFTRTDGETVAGRVIDETPSAVSVLSDPLQGRIVNLPRSEIRKREASTVSPMPDGLLDTFSAEEILDLIAFLAAPPAN